MRKPYTQAITHHDAKKAKRPQPLIAVNMAGVALVMAK
jgi:hypothetical protein